MLSEAPSGATPACAAAELVRVAAGPDRAFETRRRGARWRSRAGFFVSPLSTFAPLFVCLRGCLLAIVFVLWIGIAHRDACTTTSPALAARRGGRPGRGRRHGASRAGEVERKLWLDNFFSAGSVLERGSRYRPVPSAGSGAVALLILEQLRARAASTTLVTLPIVHCAQNWSARCSRSA